MISRSQSASSALLRWRARVIPEELQLGWVPFYLLGYLVFLVLPALFGNHGKLGDSGMPAINLWLTLASIPVFLPVYFASYRTSGWAAIACVLGMAAIACALLPFNGFANTYIIYAAGSAAMLHLSLRKRMALLALVLLVFLVELVLLRYVMFIFALTVIIAVAVFIGGHFQVENARKQGELKLSHDEVRRLAALAERERIGRDLHDLLGHTLSLVALKSELAGKLMQRDLVAAQNEIAEVSRVAREALAQVRSAVSGIRAAGIAAELASAKLLLECEGIGFHYAIQDSGLEGGALPPGVETALALTVREAVTNIQRHARASSADINFETVDGAATLRIADDGRGGSIVPGNGLAGMRERIETLGGKLSVDSTRGRGTRIEASIPLAANDDVDEPTV